jgi:serine/threonine-protein kinase
MPAQNNPPVQHPVGPESDPLIGTVLAGRYRIVRSIGQGGMGNVYEALQKPLDRRVALKLLRADSERDPQFRKRFLLEASVSAKLSHPNTITMLDYGSAENGQLYIVMELLTGRTLSRAMQNDGPFSPARAVHIARQVARSLREAHSIGIVHRDLKPANVFLRDQQDEADFVKVLDFGLVKVFGQGVEDDNTHRGVFMGTPQYVSPEQARDQAPDQRADIYSLGVLLFHMLTGRVPFDADNSVDIILKQVTEPTPQLASVQPGIDVPPELEAIVRRCLAKRREDRFQSMDEVLEALKRAGAAVGATDTQPSLPPMQQQDSLASDATPKPSTQPGMSARTRTQPPALTSRETQPPRTRSEADAQVRSRTAAPAARQAVPETLSPASFAPKSDSVVHRRVLPALLLIGGLAGAAVVTLTIRGQSAEAPSGASKPPAAATAAASVAGGAPSATGQTGGAADAARTQALLAGARNVPAFALHREALSEKQPDLPAEVASAHRGERLAGMYKVCVAPDGTIAAVTTVQSIAGADEAIANRIRSGWKYKAQTAVLCAVIPLQYEVQ